MLITTTGAGRVGQILRLIPRYHTFTPWTVRKMATSAALRAERYYADKAPPYCGLNAAKSFALLRYGRDHRHVSRWIALIKLDSEKEQKYAHYVGQASWAGARIIQGDRLRSVGIAELTGRRAMDPRGH